MSAEHLSTARNLALVEMALRDQAGAEAVRKQTGGSAPEQVQGILDGIEELRAQHRAQLRRLRERCARLIDTQYRREGRLLELEDAGQDSGAVRRRVRARDAAAIRAMPLEEDS